MESTKWREHSVQYRCQDLHILKGKMWSDFARWSKLHWWNVSWYVVVNAWHQFLSAKRQEPPAPLLDKTILIHTHAHTHIFSICGLSRIVWLLKWRIGLNVVQSLTGIVSVDGQARSPALRKRNLAARFIGRGTIQQHGLNKPRNNRKAKSNHLPRS